MHSLVDRLDWLVACSCGQCCGCARCRCCTRIRRPMSRSRPSSFVIVWLATLLLNVRTANARSGWGDQTSSTSSRFYSYNYNDEQRTHDTRTTNDLDLDQLALLQQHVRQLQSELDRAVQNTADADNQPTPQIAYSISRRSSDMDVRNVNTGHRLRHHGRSNNDNAASDDASGVWLAQASVTQEDTASTRDNGQLMQAGILRTGNSRRRNSHVCGQNRFSCPSKERGRFITCIELSQLCDGHRDCSGGEDEHATNCLFYKTTMREVQRVASLLEQLTDNVNRIAKSQQRVERTLGIHHEL